MHRIPESLLTGLNPAQREAVCHKDGPLLVLAGPGSGKTRVVTHRIAALLHQGVYPSQIVALTFTNKAADEMKKRVEALAPGKRVWMGTFHKFCAYLLRRYIDAVGLQDNFSIYDTDESLAVLKSITKGKNLPNGVNPQKIQWAVSSAKNQLILPEDYVGNYRSPLGKVVEEYYPLYQKELKRANAVDFDDLLLHVAVLLKDNPEIRKILDNRFRYVLVDEYQDTNTVQYFIAKALCLDHRNLAVTGDPDQSIYGWRGADIGNILNFEKDYTDAKIIRLEQNYRSTPQILAVADALIKHNTRRKHKELYTDNPDGKPVRLTQCADQHEEAESIAAEIAAEIKNSKRKPSEYAIFYRMNALSRNLEHALRQRLVPFQLIRGLEFYNRKEVKDVLAYLRLAYNPNDNVSLARIINEPPRGIGATTLTKLNGGAVYRGISTLEIARNISDFAGIAKRTKAAIGNFVKIIEKIDEASAQELSIESLMSMAITESGYRQQYESDAGSEEDAQRLANIDELLSVAREFDANFSGDDDETLLGRSALEMFLEQT
ncbi:MAG: UvrD-helicase domain-containing protein, partial [Planctomycetaceae bacterium]|nr:UvrD-helicase domain-containing protein [Planctomycetaceae bacterium]